MRPRPAVPALVAGLLAAVLATGVGLSGPVPAASAATVADTAPQLVVAPRNGGIAPAGRPIDVDVLVRNPGPGRLPAGTLSFSIDRAPVASTTVLLSGESSIGRPSTVLLGRLTKTRVRTPALDPGGTASVRARIGADDADSIISSADGARLLYVQLVAGAQRRVAESAVVRMGSGAPAVGFGTVVPITAPAGTTGVVDTDAQAALTAADGAWTRAVEAAEAMPAAVLALDPAVVASIRLAGDDAPRSAQQLLAGLAGLPNEVAQLPYADGDVTLQRAAGLSGRTSPTSFVGVGTTPAPTASASPAATPAAGTATPTSAADLTRWDWTGGRLLWPVPGTSSAADVAALSREGTVLLSSTDLQQGTAPAAGPAGTTNGSPALVADATASRLLARAASGGAAGDAALAPLVAALATDAVTDASPAVLAVAGRGAPGPELARVLRLLRSQRWIRGEGLEAMTSRPRGATTLRAGLTVAAARAATARGLVQDERAVQGLSTAVPDPGALTGRPRLALLALLSAQWSGELQAWTSAAASASARLRAYDGMVRILPADPRTLTGVDARLPVVVENTLSQAVQVEVTATVSNSRLRFTGTGPTRLTVPAGGTNKTQLSVRTIANGPAQITLSLATPDGAPIGRPAVRAISVRAGLDTIVAVVLLTALGLLLALGVYRNITRRRRPRPVR